MAENSLYALALARMMEGVKEPSPPRLRPSASIIPWRQAATGNIEVFWVKRSPKLGVLGGWHAFPGGGLNPKDHAISFEHPPTTDSQCPTCCLIYDMPIVDDDLAAGIVGCALRELFEETGLLLTTDTTRLTAHHTGPRDFDALLRAEDHRLDARRLHYAGRWITPPISPLRFDTRFFLLEWPHDEPRQPVVDGEELSEGEWIDCAQALELWRRGEVLATPPTLHTLDVLAEQGPRAGLKRLVQHGAEQHHPNGKYLESRTGIIALPLVTPTLPPARETISYLIGRDQALLVDVGSPFASEIKRLATMLEIMRKDFNKTIHAILLTHHHHDHVWGVNELRKSLDVPVWAHPITAEHVRALGIHVDRLIEGEPTIALGKHSSLEVTLLHTPGHAAGHLAVYEPSAHSIIAGDLVAGHGTIMIDPPDGNMHDYLNSLAKVRALEPRTLFPSHGPVITDAQTRLDLLIAHRHWREERLLELWNAGTHSLAELVTKAYDDTPAELLPFAERQALAHLARLQHVGKIPRHPIGHM